MLKILLRRGLILFLFTQNTTLLPHLHRTLGQIRELGKQSGAVLNPSTPLDLIEYVLPVCDLVLIMSVNPGLAVKALFLEVVPQDPAVTPDV